eukprot:651423-Pleurochrysis_carterae.AAC.1
MHVRHHAIGRDSIKLYDVATFSVKVDFAGVERAKTVVRVCERSLRSLAEVCPDMAMPVTTPYSQCRSRSGEGGRSG